jgi:hypothetical protein
VASDGGMFAFGDAGFHGSSAGSPLNKPVVGMAVDTQTGGYWLVASDGGIFAYDAPFLGSTGSIDLNKPIVGIAATPGGNGYWLVASDGGIFAYNAPFLGSAGSLTLSRPITGMEASPSGSGYRFVASDGGIFNYGASYDGSAVEPPAVTQPPGQTPTCSVTLSSATPKQYMGETATVTSNIPNYQVLLAKVFTKTTSYFGGYSTDANGRFSEKVSIGTATIGSPAFIAVAIGPAFCDAEFTTQ